MRPVKRERKARGNPRIKAARKPQRAVREAPKAPPTGRARANGWGRLARSPMLALAGTLVVLALLAALLVSGVIGRSVRGVQRTAAAAMADTGFGISEIHIAGNGRTPPQTILAALGLAPGQSIFAADLGAARARLLALDWIASAEVKRRYPDAIFVNLVEKRPFALWQEPADKNGDAPVAVVERAGGVITTRQIEKFAHLPKLVGAGAPAAAADLIDAVAAHRAISARIAAYERISERRWNLILDDGVVVKLPEADWQKELDTLERLIIDKGILERDVSEIDLRSPSYYFFLLKNGEQKNAPRPGKDT